MLERLLLNPALLINGFTYSFFFRLEDSKNAIILLEDGSRLVGED